jgi:hypothetical protein
MLDTIITHPGGAHQDALLAVCVLIAEFGAPVVRRETTAADLANPRVAVVDVGHVHDPATMCFDHHHFPREHPPTCALSLVLDHFGMYEDAKRFCDWLETAEWFDSRGPKKTAEHLGVPRQAVSQLNSPIDMTLLRRFAASSKLAPGDTLYEYMRFVGEDLLDYLRGVRARLDAISERVERWSVDTPGGSLDAVFLPREEASADEAPIDEPIGAVASYVRAHGLMDTTAALVYPDRARAFCKSRATTRTRFVKPARPCGLLRLLPESCAS